MVRSGLHIGLGSRRILGLWQQNQGLTGFWGEIGPKTLFWPFRPKIEKKSPLWSKNQNFVLTSRPVDLLNFSNLGGLGLRSISGRATSGENFEFKITFLGILPPGPHGGCNIVTGGPTPNSSKNWKKITFMVKKSKCRSYKPPGRPFELFESRRIRSEEHFRPRSKRRKFWLQNHFFGHFAPRAPRWV